MRPLMPPVQTPDNLFHDGNPLTGELGTIVDAEHLNNEQAAIRDTQSELIAILTAAAMEPESTAGQLLAALNKLYAPLNDTLGALSSLVGGANKLPYFTSANAAALTALSSIGRDIVGKATVADVLTYLGFTQVGRDIIAGGTASDVLAYLGVPNLLNGKQDADNTLTALARLAGAANKLPYFSGPDVMSMTDFSDIGREIIAASDKPSVLSYLELTTLGQALVKGGTASDILRTLGFNNGNGWYRIGEILIQFGHIPFAATSVPVTFPIPFPVVIDQIIVSDAGYASGNTWGATDRTQLGFTAQTNSTGQGGQYFAIGR